MSKTVAKIALVVGAVVLTVASGGSLTGLAVGALQLAGIGAATAGVIGGIAATLLVTTALTAAVSLVTGSKSGSATSAAQLSRLNVSLIPSTPRIIAFGNTALATDMRASIPTGADQDIQHYIICCASHTVTSIDEVWFEDRLAWSASGGVAAFYSGYLLPVVTKNPGTNANGVAINSQWTSSCTLTGCAYIYFYVKRSGNNKKAESPLPSGIPSRVTIIGKGIKVYDPRLDSTVAGGSGAHRAATQTTWEYSNGGIDRGNNPALQILTYLLGWQINGKLAVGKGMPAVRIDLPSFIAAANICDEAVTLAIGGTQRRYESHGLFSENDSPNAVMDALLTACNGRMTDVNGKLGIVCATNDLTGALYQFTDDDVLDAFEWNPSPSIHETHNIVRGRWTDPSSNSLYQLVDYPAVRITSPDGIDRVLTLDLPVVQDGKRAQRIAKQILQREQYQGTFAAIFGIRAWGVKVGDPVKLTFAALAFTNKLFRVVQQGIRSDGTVQLILREENTALYAWSSEESALVTVAAPTVYNQTNNPFAIFNGVDIGVENGATKNAAQTYRVRTRGYLSALPGGDTRIGLWNEDTDTSIAGVSNTYTVAYYRVDVGSWTYQHFDVLSNATVTSIVTGTTMDSRSAMGVYLNFINSTYAGWPVVVYGWDEPSAGRLVGSPYDIPTQMYRAGASRAVFGSAKFAYRGAYLLVGIAGSGEGNGAEYLAGAGVPSSYEATIDVGFTMTPAGVLSIAGKTPGGADDLAYASGVTIEALKPSQAGADVTASNAPSIVGSLLWAINADVAGTVTTVLPATRRFSARQGTTDVSTTTAWVISDATPAIALTVNNTSGSADRGVVTLGTGTTGSGTAKLTATLPAGAVVAVVVTVTKTNAAAPATGVAGSTFALDSTFTNVTSGTHAAISDELTVRSDGSAHVRISLSAAFMPISGTATANVASKFSYATTSGGSLTDLISEVTGAASIYLVGDLSREEGAINHAEATFTMPAANTDYYFKALARRVTGSVNISFSSANFTVRQ